MHTVLRFWHSTIGKKVTMAVTGLILIGFLISHVASNLLVFQGPEKINEYAVFLREFGPLLWVARAGLLIAAVLHVVAGIQLARISRAARPTRYAKSNPQASTIASRTMLAGGIVLLLFIVYHILHFTTGTLHPSFQHLDPYGNIMRAFRSPLVVAIYLVGMVALGLHLYQGAWSSVRTLGLNRPSATPLKRRVSFVVAAAIYLGFSVIPVAVLLGVLP